MTDHAPTPPGNTPPLAQRTTPTWEVELLISGVAVFAMLQLAGWLDDRMFALEPRLEQNWRIILLLSYTYAKSTTVVLAVTFALHLLLRAQWIALVGIHSVYPQGVRLERMQMGPIQRAIENARQQSPDTAIERADNRASVVFAIGVSVAIILAFVCVCLCGTLLMATLLLQALGWQVEPFAVMAILIVVAMTPLALVTTLDRRQSLREGGLAHRIVGALLRFYARIGMGRNNNHIISILTSNDGERRTMAMVVGAMLAASVGVGLSYAAMRSPGAIGSYALFPNVGARIDPVHYDDQRDPTRDEAQPYVQSMVIADPYLKLVVPYHPRRDVPAMRECKTPEKARSERANALLDCLRTLHAVTLDGKPLADLRYEIASDPRTDRPALLAMIDVRALAQGRHELRIAQPPPERRKPGKDASAQDDTRIVFWR